MPKTDPLHDVEAIQERLARQVQQGAKDTVVRQALRQFDPRVDDQRQSYAEVLRRLQEALTLEIARLPAMPPETS
jgi:hypothetical protein